MGALPRKARAAHRATTRPASSATTSAPVTRDRAWCPPIMTPALAAEYHKEGLRMPEAWPRAVRPVTDHTGWTLRQPGTLTAKGEAVYIAPDGTDYIRARRGARVDLLMLSRKLAPVPLRKRRGARPRWPDADADADADRTPGTCPAHLKAHRFGAKTTAPGQQAPATPAAPGPVAPEGPALVGDSTCHQLAEAWGRAVEQWRHVEAHGPATSCAARRAIATRRYWALTAHVERLTPLHAPRERHTLLAYWLPQLVPDALVPFVGLDHTPTPRGPKGPGPGGGRTPSGSRTPKEPTTAAGLVAAGLLTIRRTPEQLTAANAWWPRVTYHWNARDVRLAAREAFRAGPPSWLRPVTPPHRMTPAELDKALAREARRLAAHPGLSAEDCASDSSTRTRPVGAAA